MTMPLNIAAPGASAAGVGFETPLEMLAECHRRVERQCATLRRLVPHLAAHGSDAAAAGAATAVMRYFDLAAPKHHADEEEDLFPALLETVAGSDAVCIHGIVDALLADHDALERGWAAIRAVLAQVAAGRPAVLPEAEVRAFTERYERHIAREEGELMPMAARLLDDAQLERIGRAMRRRRGDAAT